MSCEASRFPDPRSGPADAPLAVGGDLEPATLLDAYSHGIFPWPTGPGAMLWWSPEPRAIIPLDGLRASRNARRLMRSGQLSTTFDRAFASVVAGCADRPGEGSWITPSIADAYCRLHETGAAHSVEVWDGAGELVGGLYGVAIGGAFSGESMFHRVSDASKVALVALVDRLVAAGFGLLDAQVPTPHLTSLGAVSISRERFLDLLEAQRGRRCQL